LKATAQVPHGGGRKIEKDSLRYRLLFRWLHEGARFSSAAAPAVASIEVEPVQRILNAGGTQQLRVTALDVDGNRRCVTTEAEYADYWAMRWSDILRVDKDNVTPQGAVAISRWLRRQFAENRPYDQFVRDVLTVQGSTAAEGPAAFYKVLNTPDVMSRSISQVF